MSAGRGVLRVDREQMTEGQLQCGRLEEQCDTVLLGRGSERRAFHIHAGKEEMRESLRRQFPNDTLAVDQLMRLMKVPNGAECGGHCVCCVQDIGLLV